jgi:hypothetical protein
MFDQSKTQYNCRQAGPGVSHLRAPVPQPVRLSRDKKDERGKKEALTGAGPSNFVAESFMEALGDAVVGRVGGCVWRITQGEGAERGEGGNPPARRQGDPATGRARSCAALGKKRNPREISPWAIALCLMSCVCSATGGARGEARPLGVSAAPASQLGQRHSVAMEATAALHLRGGGTHDGRKKKMKRAHEAEEKRRRRVAEAEQARISAKKAKQFEKRKARLER